jgi:hypothetical protein
LAAPRDRTAERSGTAQRRGNSPVLDGIQRRAEPKFPLLVVGISGTFSGEDVMIRQVEELLLLTCLGGFVAGVTYALTLLH